MVFITTALETILRFADYPQSPWRPPPPSVIDPYDSNPYLLKGRPFLHTYRPDTLYTMKFDVFEVENRINSRGFRGPELTTRPKKGKKRLLVIGDSMVEGHGVKFGETFSALLNHSQTLEGWEIINLGIQGGSPAYYCANLPRYLALYPDAVLLVLYDNDPRDDYGMNFNYKGLDFFPDAPRILVDGGAPNRGGFRLWRLAKNALRFDRAKGLRDSSWEGLKAVESLNSRLLAENKAFGAPFEFPADIYTISESEWKDAWAITSEYLSLFHKELEEREIPLLLAQLSVEYSMADSPPERRRHAGMFGDSSRKWAQERHIPFLAFESAPRSELEAQGRPEIIFPIDGHLNPLGHRRAAQILEPWLAARLREFRDTPERP